MMGNAAIFTCQLNIWSVLARLVLATVIGGAIGLERETKNRPAGFRTYMLVALGATIAMILNQYLDFMQTGPWTELTGSSNRTDVSRLGAQVVNGVGFLGAGTILVTQRQEVKGLTTAAGLWTSACLGLSIGAGLYECAVVGMLLIIVCMGTFSRIEHRLMNNAKNINVYIELENYDHVASVAAGIRNLGMKIFNVDVSKNINSNGTVSATFDILLSERTPHERVLIRLSAIDGIMLVNEI